MCRYGKCFFKIYPEFIPFPIVKKYIIWYTYNKKHVDLCFYMRRHQSNFPETVVFVSEIPDNRVAACF